MTQAMNKLYQRLEKDGWYCHLERDTLREVFWLAAEPPKGFSWSEMKAELWNYAKAEFGLRANVREKNNFFIVEDLES